MSPARAPRRPNRRAEPTREQRLDDQAVRNRLAEALGIDLACLTRDGTGFGGARNDRFSVAERWRLIGAMRAAGISIRRTAHALGVDSDTVCAAARGGYVARLDLREREEGDPEFARGIARCLGLDPVALFRRDRFGSLGRGELATQRRGLFLTLHACGWGGSRISHACGVSHTTVFSVLRDLSTRKSA